MTASYVYDGLDRLKALTHSAGATTLIDNQYKYSGHNISTWVNAAGEHSYNYDPVDRLTSGTSTLQPNENYGYDEVGNRTSSHLSGNYKYQPFNRLTDSDAASYSYDANGNLISKKDSDTTTFSWSEENQLTQVDLPTGLTVNYKYDVAPFLTALLPSHLPGTVLTNHS